MIEEPFQKSPRGRIWTLVQARLILPEIRDITRYAHCDYTRLSRTIKEQIIPENEQEEMEGYLQQILQKWANGVVSLGAEAKGLWLVDFDNGHGYYCWQYNESDLLFEHSYEAGFSGRKPILPESNDIPDDGCVGEK